MTSLTADSAFAQFLERNPTATVTEAFLTAWQLCVVRSPEASADENDATYRRNFKLRIENMTVDTENVITWMQIECRGRSQGLYQLAARATLSDEQREAIKYARSVMGSVSWETPDSIRAKNVIDALLASKESQ